MCIFSGRFKCKISLRPFEGLPALDAKSLGTFFTFVGKPKECGRGEGGAMGTRGDSLGRARPGLAPAACSSSCVLPSG